MRIIGVGKHMIQKASLVLITAAIAAALFPACASSPGPDSIRFGLWAAQNGLWDEAIFRWTKALEARPDSVVAHNNLGVAYEKKGLFDAAMKEYEAALKIDPQNEYVKSNYKNCKENIQPPVKEEKAKNATPEKK